VGEILSFLEFVELLSGSAQARSDFAADPDATLSAHGRAGLSPADVRDAIALVEDNRTVDWSDAYGSGAPADVDSLAFGSGTTAPTDDHPGTVTGSGMTDLPDGARYDGDVDPADDTLGPASDTPDPDDIAVGPDTDPGVDDVLHDHTDLAFG
jgi:hypothetical protein